MSDYSHLTQHDPTVGDPVTPFDPLRLCVFTTVALLACLFGPAALAVFAFLAIGGYSRARRAGLVRSRCKLGDTRLVLAYLWMIAVLAVAATPLWILMWARVLG